MTTNLNSEQQKAVQATEGPVLILAGAGAGKTKTLTERIQHLVHSGVAPSAILAITFTNKAAREMRERVIKSLKENKDINRPIEMSERPFVSTFHSLGVHMLREQSSKLSVTRNFTIFDKDDGRRSIKEALEKVGLDPKTHDPAQILSIISKEKGRGVVVSEYQPQGHPGHFSQVVAQVWQEYEKNLKRDNALDFDDLLLKTRNLLRDHAEVRGYYHKVWRYIMIDEYQDTNRVQYEIAKMLLGPEHNICAVGDIDQSIYSWRGADIKNILDFEKDYPKAQIILLEQNYRSTKTILNAANIVIEKNQIRRKKNLFTENGDGDKIGLMQAYDEVGEAEFVAIKAEDLIKAGTPPEEIAVLYRANFQSRVLEESFMNHTVPYQILGTRFFDRREVKDIVSYLRAALTPENLSDLKRVINVPARGIGKVTVAKIFSGQEASLPVKTLAKVASFRKLLGEIREQAERGKPSEVVSFIIKASGLEAEWKESKKDEDLTRLENAYELVNFASRYDHTPGEDGVLGFLSDAALQSDQDELEDDGGRVRLLTVHSSKGLEFDVVFIVGLEDGLFPHGRGGGSDKTPEESEEERRLFYVALTRARKKVFLSYTQVRSIFGRKQVNLPSEFIFDVPEESIEEEHLDERAITRRSLLDIEF